MNISLFFTLICMIIVFNHSERLFRDPKFLLDISDDLTIMMVKAKALVDRIRRRFFLFIRIAEGISVRFRELFCSAANLRQEEEA